MDMHAGAAAGPKDESALNGVLASALPSSLGTDSAPARYTVSAVFTRRPLAAEIALIQGEIARTLLAEGGYGGITLKVVDRRLEIGPTNLDELKSGLAALVAEVLHDAWVAVATQDARHRVELDIVSDEETRRSKLILESASQVLFTRAPAGASDAPTSVV